MPKYYHGTATKYEKSILKKGLLPKDPGSDVTKLEVVWLDRTPEGALEEAIQMQIEVPEIPEYKITIFEVTLPPELERHFLDADYDSPTELAVPTRISPKYLRIFKRIDTEKFATEDSTDSSKWPEEWAKLFRELNA